MLFSFKHLQDFLVIAEGKHLGHQKSDPAVEQHLQAGEPHVGVQVIRA